MGNLVTVIIPTYKERGGLEIAINSVLNQTYNNIEIIVVDDNGRDTAGQLRTKMKMDQYLRSNNIRYLVHEHNKNGAAARNTGIRAATGKYIAFLDDDDHFKSGKIKAQTEYLDSHTEFDCVYCRASSNGKDIATVPYQGDCSLPLLLGKTSMYTPSLLFRRDALIAIGGFDESFRRHQDYELLLKFFSHGHKIGYLPQSLLVLGSNAGENILHGDDFINLKRQFLNQFAVMIDELDRQHPGSKKNIYAHHYATVFIDCIKCHRLIKALKIAIKYAPMSPKFFFSPLIYSASHLIRK